MVPIAWEGLLQRPPLMLDKPRAAASFAGRRILITGAGGSIGSALARALAEFSPQCLVLLEAAEQNLYEVDAALRPFDHISVLGSVAQPRLLAEVFAQHQPDVVYHAAAFKHVPLMEQNPFAAIENNALATHQLVQAGRAHGVKELCLISTDKAADPVSIMGASKRIAELAVLAAGMKAVRLGNVLGSAGSIVPLFLQQIAAGQAVTVTHPHAQRFFLTVGEAVTLLLAAASEHSGLMAGDLGQPIAVEALARYLIAVTAADSNVAFTQLRPGDKLCEVMLSSRESYAAPSGLLRHVTTPTAANLDEILRHLQQACQERSREELLRGVLQAVPEYQPSTLIRGAIELPA